MFAALFLSLALGGQEDPCDRRPATEACDLARFEMSLAKLPVPAIEDEAKAGAEVYRGRVLDAWSSPQAVVSFERRPGQAPMVVVRGYGGATISGPVTRELWDRVQAASVFADRELAPTAPTPAPASGGEVLDVCMDGRTAMVEMANAPADWGDKRTVRRRISGSCATDLTTTFIDSLPALAIAALPACAALSPDRGEVYRLGECLALRGDLLAAADLMNATREEPVDDMSEAAWRRWLQIDGVARLDWAGETVTQRGFVMRAEPSIANFMAEKASTLEALSLYSGEVGAEDAKHGWITGLIVYHQDGAGEREQMVANYRQVWSKANGGWSLVSWTVEPFKPLE